MPLFLDPIFKERIWGSHHLSKYGYSLPESDIGEIWTISAHPHGDSVISNGPFKGQTLSYVWQTHKELFGDFPSAQFPLMVKMIDAQEALSVQVHPDTAYAYEHEDGDFGKKECWYIIEADEDAEIIYGLNTESKDDFVEALDQGEHQDLFKHIPVQAGDFFFVPNGIVHAIGKGLVVYEVTQASDVTYRIYDYERVDAQGQPRDMHIDKAKDVVEVREDSPNVIPESEIIENHKRTTYITHDAFTVVKWEITGTLNYMKPREFCLVTVLHGEGQLITDGDVYDIASGSSFILTSEDLDNIFEGDLTVMITYV
ncbi:mannose-6-phosphate isomerase, class I [Staphylococcus simulans]|uniref:mannose-6-phosphate isomerase, class I n=1 Tax=Staphylococcus simulans TaxID=1286 RepID=UPI000D1DAFDF|nr:mannose-6-phosphate isomerase, class I [Staphylococcus simulans]PTJ91319.1 mannose-6-phosphate isomerase, class I [Staphylococcus simulans]